MEVAGARTHLAAGAGGSQLTAMLVGEAAAAAERRLVGAPAAGAAVLQWTTGENPPHSASAPTYRESGREMDRTLRGCEMSVHFTTSISPNSEFGVVAS